MENIIGIRLRSLRRQNGLDITELSDIIKYSKSSMCNFELGRQLPPRNLLEKLARFYKVDPDYIMGYIDSYKKDETQVLINELITKIMGKDIDKQQEILHLLLDMTK